MKREMPNDHLGAGKTNKWRTAEEIYQLLAQQKRADKLLHKVWCLIPFYLFYAATIYTLYDKGYFTPPINDNVSGTDYHFEENQAEIKAGVKFIFYELLGGIGLGTFSSVYAAISFNPDHTKFRRYFEIENLNQIVSDNIPAVLEPLDDEYWPCVEGLVDLVAYLAVNRHNDALAYWIAAAYEQYGFAVLDEAEFDFPGIQLENDQTNHENSNINNDSNSDDDENKSDEHEIKIEINDENQNPKQIRRLPSFMRGNIGICQPQGEKIRQAWFDAAEELSVHPVAKKYWNNHQSQRLSQSNLLKRTKSLDDIIEWNQNDIQSTEETYYQDFRRYILFDVLKQITFDLSHLAIETKVAKQKFLMMFNILLKDTCFAADRAGIEERSQLLSLLITEVGGYGCYHADTLAPGVREAFWALKQPQRLLLLHTLLSGCSYGKSVANELVFAITRDHFARLRDQYQQKYGFGHNAWFGINPHLPKSSALPVQLFDDEVIENSDSRLSGPLV